MTEKILPEEIPLDFLKHYLRVDHNFDDIEIQLYYQGVISYVRNYIKQPDDIPMTDLSLCIPILTLVAYCYETRTPITKTTERQDQIFTSMLELHRSEIL